MSEAHENGAPARAPSEASDTSKLAKNKALVSGAASLLLAELDGLGSFGEITLRLIVRDGWIHRVESGRTRSLNFKTDGASVFPSGNSFPLNESARSGGSL